MDNKDKALVKEVHTRLQNLIDVTVSSTPVGLQFNREKAKQLIKILREVENANRTTGGSFQN